MRRTFEEEFTFSPMSFMLPEQKSELKEFMNENPKSTFICKPNAGRGGEGIFLISKFDELPKNLWTSNL